MSQVLVPGGQQASREHYERVLVIYIVSGPVGNLSHLQFIKEIPCPLNQVPIGILICDKHESILDCKSSFDLCLFVNLRQILTGHHRLGREWQGCRREN